MIDRALQRTSQFRARRFLAFALLGAIATVAVAQSITYTYDEAGRLKSATNLSGETAEYVYDAAGNLTQIRRTAAGIPAVTDFTPDKGPVGTVVTIFGANFNGTPANNTVRFNGTAATVTSASTTQLVTSVPTGATTGTISVQTAAGTGTSAQAFTVGATGILPPPTISTFSPALGRPGVTVTVTGTNFDTVAGRTKVYLNQSLVPIQSVTSTSITFKVPDATGAGKIRVLTPTGTATSGNDFIVPPILSANYLDANYTGTPTRVSVGGSGNMAITASSGTFRWSVFLFEGGPDAALTFDFTALTVSPAGQKVTTWEIRNTRNEMMTSADYEGPNYCTACLSTPEKRSIHVPPMPVSGTYALFVQVNGNALTNLNMTAALNADAVLPIDGLSGVSFARTFAGQSTRFIYNASQGQRLGMGLQGYPTSGVLIGFNTPQWKSVLDGISSINFGCYPLAPPTGACGRNMPIVTSSGPYSLIVGASSLSSTTGTAWLSTDLEGSLTPSVDLSTPTFKVGQNGRYTFTGTTGGRVGVTFSNVTFAPTSAFGRGQVKLIHPDGTDVSGASFNLTYASGASTSFEFPSLPATGTYTVFVDPADAAGGSATIRLWQTLTGTIAVDGASLPLTMTKGQKARISFTATAGQSVGLGISALTYDPSGSNDATSFNIIRVSDGVSVGSTTARPNDNPFKRWDVDLPKLNAGTYYIEITPPPGVNTADLTLTLSQDMAGTLTVNTPNTINITRIGQNVRYAFAGTAGQRVRISYAGTSFAPNQNVSVRVLRADGTTAIEGPFGVGYSYGATIVREAPQPPSTGLPATETYYVYIDPDNGSTGSITVTVAQDATGSLTIDGSSVSASTSVPGQQARYTFTNSTAGQNLGLGLSALAHTPSSPVGGALLIVRNSSEVQVGDVVGCHPSNPGCDINLTNLPIGTYSVIVQPTAIATSSTFTLTLSSDLPGTLPLITPTAISIPRHGQNARYTFTATAGQNRKFKATGVTTTPAGQYVSFILYSPTGANLGGGSFSAGGTWEPTFNNLPATGTYTLFLNPYLGVPSSLTLEMTQP